MRYIGTAKNATADFPKEFLRNALLQENGNFLSMVSRNNKNCHILAVAWAESDRKYFINTALDCSDGLNSKRDRYRIVDGNTVLCRTNTFILKVAESYFNVCFKFDERNRCSQQGLKLEKKICTKNWAKEVVSTLLGFVLSIAGCSKRVLLVEGD